VNPFYQQASERLIAKGKAGGQHSASIGASTRDLSDDEQRHLDELAAFEAARDEAIRDGRRQSPF
jgi:hypothetical protein